jgi:hypothetical protein
MTSRFKTNKKLFFGAMVIVVALALLLVDGTA